jgi:hypothetical protein
MTLNTGSGTTSVSTGTEITEKDACSVVTNTATKQVSDLLLVLDRSSSMQNAMDSDRSCTAGRLGGGAAACQSRWEVMQATLKQVLATSAGSVNWGLLMFSSPGKGNCTVDDKVQVEIGAANANADILSKISSAGTQTTTPTRKGVSAGVKYLQGLKGTESKSILLATDGEPNCAGEDSNGGDDVGPATDAIKAAYEAGFKVYVLGIGPEANASTLKAFAQNGGTENYFAAGSAEELAKQFKSIVGSVASCTLTLEKAPDPSVPVVVEFDGNKDLRAPQDKTNGWDYGTTASGATDRKTIQLYGSWCEGLTNGTYNKAKVLVGCKDQPIP